MLFCYLFWLFLVFLVNKFMYGNIIELPFLYGMI